MTGRRIIWAFFFISCVLFLSRCNVFSIFNFGFGYEGKISQAEAAYAAGDYRTAMEKYEEAIAANPRGGEARMGYVNAAARHHLVDFLWLAQTLTSTNRDFGTTLNDWRVRENILGKQGFFGKTVTVLKPIVDGQCDASVPANDISANLQIGLAYLVKALGGLLDTDGNGHFGGTNDILVFSASGMPVPNTNVLNLSILANFESLSNMTSFSNLTFGSSGTLSSSLQAFHDLAETTLKLCRTVAGSFVDLDNAYAAIYRIAEPYTNRRLLRDTLRMIVDFREPLDGFQTAVEEAASGFNDIHQNVVGTRAYTTVSVGGFVETPFAGHVGAASSYPGYPIYLLSTDFSMFGDTNALATNASFLTNLFANFTNYSFDEGFDLMGFLMSFLSSFSNFLP